MTHPPSEASTRGAASAPPPESPTSRAACSRDVVDVSALTRAEVPTIAARGWARGFEVTLDVLEALLARSDAPLCSRDRTRAAGAIVAAERFVDPLLKTNLGGKIALRVATQTNSRIILDEGGAEKLLGKGDLYANLGHGIVRAQAPIIE